MLFVAYLLVWLLLLPGSWPALAGEDSLTTVKTPAVISPLIRSVVRLWCHETLRTYSDRLLTEQQKYWFATLLNDQVEECFCTGSPESTVCLLQERPEDPEQMSQGKRGHELGRECFAAVVGLRGTNNKLSNGSYQPQLDEET